MITGDGIVLGAGGETASIVVTGPTGSTVTCTTPAGIVLNAAEVSGTWTFARLKVYGTYTITATNGTDEATLDVLVDSANVFNVEIYYKLWLYKDGDECEDVTGRWDGGYTDGAYPLSTAVKNSDNLYFNSSMQGLGTVNSIDLTNYTKLCAEIMSNSSSATQPWIGYVDSKAYSTKVSSGCTSKNVREIVSIDISAVTGNKYILCASTGNGIDGYVYKVWLE